MDAFIRPCHGTLSEWLEHDPILAKGEVALVATDDTKPDEYNSKKVGDGVRKFSQLPMLGYECLQTTGNSSLFPMSQDATTKAIAAGAQAIITLELTEEENTVPSNAAIKGTITSEITDDPDKVPSSKAVKDKLCGVTKIFNASANTPFTVHFPISIQKGEYFRVEIEEDVFLDNRVNIIAVSDGVQQVIKENADSKSVLLFKAESDIEDLMLRKVNNVINSGEVSMRIEKGFSAKQIGYKDSSVFDELNEINSELDSIKSTTISIELTDEDKGYVDINSYSIVNNQDYAYKDIELTKGDKLILVARGAVNNTAMVSLHGDVPNVYKPLIVPTQATVDTYIYDAPENCAVRIGWRIAYQHDCKIVREYNLSEVSELTKEYENVSLLPLFNRLGVIGDSLSSGAIVNPGATGGAITDYERFSWLSYLCRDAGIEAEHYSKGGLTTKTWLSDEGGKRTKFEEDEICDGYFIALGTNDKNHGATDIPIGDIDDASSAESFVGYYKKIIELVHSKNPSAPVFLVSMYSALNNSGAYSSMIKDMADSYDYCFFIDLKNNTFLDSKRNNVYTSDSHFTAIGYRYIAKTIEKLVDEVVIKNMARFKFLGS